MNQDKNEQEQEAKEKDLGLYLALGISIGFVAGLIILDNGPLGAGLGIVFALMIGSI